MAEPTKSLPIALDAERLVLGSVMLDESHYYDVAGVVTADDFCLEKHRRILKRMAALKDRGEHIDRITVAHELDRYGELESVDGLSYLVSLDDGLPQVPHLDSYIRQIKEKSIKRQIIFAAQATMNRAFLDEEHSKDILAGATETLLSLGVEDTNLGPRNAEQIIERAGGISAVLGPPKQGLSTGFTKFDSMTAGLHEQELIVIAARPSIGKSALALNIGQHVAIKQSKGVAVFSLEMSEQSLLTRLLCAEARVDSQRFRAGYLSVEERRRLNYALGKISDAPLYIDDTSGLDLMEMNGKLRRLMQRHQISLVIVDYLQLMTTRGRRAENRNQEVTALSAGLKRMAKDLHLPIIVLSQLNRAVETRKGGGNRPQLSDLRESGAIEQDADVVVFIFRAEVYDRDREDLRGLAELIVAKQRNGPVGTVNLVFLHQQTQFANRAEDVGDESQESLGYAT